MTYKLEIKKSALKALQKLDKQAIEKIKNKIDDLASDPRPPGCKKLTDEENLYRIRVGNYRVIYEIHDAVLIIVILQVARRRENTYKN